MKGIMITAPASNMGKTFVTLSILRILNNKGIDVKGYKAGSDFIDKYYQEIASKSPSGNLDIYMQGKKGMKKSLGFNQGEIAIIEGAMGYFDGIYNTWENSSYHISKVLDIPTILVYEPIGEMFTAIPKIKGIVDFSEGQIVGIILNKTNKRMYKLLKPKIENYIGLKVLGYIPHIKDLEIESELLGLKLMDEIKSDEYIERVSKQVEKTIDIKSIINLSKPLEVEVMDNLKKRDLKVGVAKDNAFNFHYRENLELLSKTTDVEYFSPLNDTEIPEADLIILGGGYPEKYKRELSNNIMMKRSILKYIESGGFLLAEGGGYIYLNKSLDGYPMLNVFSGEINKTEKIEKIGYTKLILKEDTILGKKDSKLYGKEFRKTKIDKPGKILKVLKEKENETWSCGKQYKNTLGHYQHLNFLGNLNSFFYLLDLVENDGER